MLWEREMRFWAVVSELAGGKDGRGGDFALGYAVLSASGVG